MKMPSPAVIPAEAGIHFRSDNDYFWIPAFAGMTNS
jgi:hypothetical protein